MKSTLSDSLINYYVDVLVQTEYGLTWTQIAKFFRRKSAEYKVDCSLCEHNISFSLAKSKNWIYSKPKSLLASAAGNVVDGIVRE